MTSPLNTPLVNAIEAIVRGAGAMMRTAFNDPSQPAYSLKGRQDYLTVTDGAVERYVRAEIASRFPGDGVLGEEEGAQGGSGLATPRLWIVDPIDGTANFARQIPHFCISLGLMVDGVLEAGAIYHPMADELYIAQRGLGAFLNGRRMQVSTLDDMAQSSLEIGWSTRLPTTTYLDIVHRAMDAGAAVRRAGSGSLGLAYVAAGRCEAYAEAHINAWDVAAGLLLVTEAGGCVNDFWAGTGLAKGNPVLATNRMLSEKISVLTGIPLRAAALP